MIHNYKQFTRGVQKCLGRRMYVKSYIAIYFNIFILAVEGNSLKEGNYIIRTFDYLLPEAGITEGVGGLVGFNIQQTARKLKLEQDQEELCGAKSCQAPQAHNSRLPNSELRWVKCDSSQCKKWFHLQCVGVEEDAELPRKWFCGCSKFERENILRYNQ